MVSGDGDAKEQYAHDNPRARYCFADKDFGQDEAPHSQTRVFFNYHLYENDYDEWGPVFRAQASRPETIMRGYVINEDDFWGDALAAGANLLTTDMVKKEEWAMVSSSAPFTKLKPLG